MVVLCSKISDRIKLNFENWSLNHLKILNMEEKMDFSTGIIIVIVVVVILLGLGYWPNENSGETDHEAKLRNRKEQQELQVNLNKREAKQQEWEAKQLNCLNLMEFLESSDSDVREMSTRLLEKMPADQLVYEAFILFQSSSYNSNTREMSSKLIKKIPTEQFSRRVLRDFLKSDSENIRNMSAKLLMIHFIEQPDL